MTEKEYNSLSNSKNWIEERTIYKVISGSHAYGLNTPESDIDIRGVCIPPEELIIGMRKFEQDEDKQKDITIFNIYKFFKLAADCNPNIIELLFIEDPDLILVFTPSWGEVYKNRHLFLSQKAKWSYSGYAHSQIKRVKTHRNWLLNPPKKKPERSDFGLPETSKMPAELQGAITARMADTTNLTDFQISKLPKDKIGLLGDYLDIPKNIMQLYQLERSYKNVLNQWNQYQDWKKNRNPERAKLEEEFGYDTKHMSHTFRLIIQGEEILTKGSLCVKLRGVDRELVLDIKNGVYVYDDVLETAERRISMMENMSENFALPKSPDRAKIDQLLMKIIKEHFGWI